LIDRPVAGLSPWLRTRSAPSDTIAGKSENVPTPTGRQVRVVSDTAGEEEQPSIPDNWITEFAPELNYVIVRRQRLV
jgi:hypothetical protein